MSRDEMSNDKGQKFEMGADIQDCKAGDGVKVSHGTVETIKSISNCGKWDKTIETEEGGSYSMMQVYAYGKRKDKSSD